MNTLSSFLGLSGLALLVFNGTPATAEARGTPCARVAVVIGVPVDMEQSPIAPGKVLMQGSRLQTGEGAYIKLILKDESILDIGPSSSIVLKSCETKNQKVDIDLELELGNVRANVVKQEKVARKDFKLRTPTSVLGVRGTEFFVSWKKDSSGVISEQIGVSKGQVEVASLFDQKTPSIPLGTGTEFKAEGKITKEGGEAKLEMVTPPQVDQFSASEQRQLEEGTKVEQRPFEKAVEIPATKDSEKSSDSQAQNQRKERAENFLVAKLQEKEPQRKLSSESSSSPNPDNAPGPQLPVSGEKKEDPRKQNLETLTPGSVGSLPPRPGTVGTDVNLAGIPIYTSITAVWSVKADGT